MDPTNAADRRMARILSVYVYIYICDMYIWGERERERDALV